MLSRTIQNSVENALSQVPAVALLGARQVGKTTLAKGIAQGVDSIYLDLEDPQDLLKLTDPTTFLRNQRNKLVILDEIQRMPDLFMVLRGIIDENRAEGRRAGQFLLLGSASRDLLRQSSESLAGRIRYLEMGGFNLLELKGVEHGQKLWMRGGFPESFLAKDDNIAMDWLEDLIRTYLERDIPQMGFRIPSTKLRRLWTMLAHLQGETLNYAQLATNLEINSKTVKHYLDILSDLLLVRVVSPWYGNVKKRLVKSPRYYIRDSGIQHRLLGIENHDSLLSNPVLGKSWEGFVVENIHAMLPRRSETFFYRTSIGAEIDLIIKLPDSSLWAVEIKYGVAPKIRKNYSTLAQEIGASKQYVVYGGEESFSIAHSVEMISLSGLLKKLVSYAF